MAEPLGFKIKVTGYKPKDKDYKKTLHARVSKAYDEAMRDYLLACANHMADVFTGPGAPNQRSGMTMAFFAGIGAAFKIKNQMEWMIDSSRGPYKGAHTYGHVSYDPFAGSNKLHSKTYGAMLGKEAYEKPTHGTPERSVHKWSFKALVYQFNFYFNYGPDAMMPMYEHVFHEKFAKSMQAIFNDKRDYQRFTTVFTTSVQPK